MRLSLLSLVGMAPPETERDCADVKANLNKLELEEGSNGAGVPHLQGLPSMTQSRQAGIRTFLGFEHSPDSFISLTLDP